MEDAALFKDQNIKQFLNVDFLKYKFSHVEKEDELFMPRAWDMPEVFRKKLVSFSSNTLHEVNLLNHLTESVRYNFSNGMQLSAQDILRHPLAKKVPIQLLPHHKFEISPADPQWPLLGRFKSSFKSQIVNEVENIMQAVMNQISRAIGQQTAPVFLQTFSNLSKAFQIHRLEVDLKPQLDWRVLITEYKKYSSEFKLISKGPVDIYFLSSFALRPDDQAILLYPWRNEFICLDEKLKSFGSDVEIFKQSSPYFELESQSITKKTIQYLKSRAISITIGGEAIKIPVDHHLLHIHLSEKKDLDIVAMAKVPNHKDLFKNGWSEISSKLISSLSEGMSFYLQAEPKELASHQARRREWDLKILKHTGILQYITYEVLHFLFHKELSDGRIIESDSVFVELHENIKNILVSGPGNTFYQDQSLTDLCSKSVLIYFEKWVDELLIHFNSDESYYSENGEVILERFVEKELRLIFTLMQKMIFDSSGEFFKKPRSSFQNQMNLLSKHLVDFLNSLQPLIPHGFVIYYNDKPLLELSEDQFQVDFVLESDLDQNKNFNWFELNPQFFLNGKAVDPDRFLTGSHGGIIEYDGQVYILAAKQIPSLRRLQHFWQKLQKGKIDQHKQKKNDKIYQLPRNQTLELLALRASGIQIRGDHEWKRLCEFYDQLGSTRPANQIPKSIKADLKPYQVYGVQWILDLYNLKLGALLADDMGLGKTLQALCFLEILRQNNDLGQVLIVVPSSLIFNWQNEIEKFAPELPLMIFNSKNLDAVGQKFANQTPVLVITTYGLLLEHDQYFDQYKWKTVIFDEAQNLKNIATKRTTAARSLTAQFKICLTGTPMENHYGEFYSLMDILVPGSLGRIEDFRRQFVNTDIVTSEQMSDLKLKMKPLLLRRTKKEILDQLPMKQESKLSIAFEDQQKEIYRDIALSYNRQIQDALTDANSQTDTDKNAADMDTDNIEDSGEFSAGNVKAPNVQLQMLTALLRLRQACSDPAALPNVKYDKIPPKVQTLLESVSEIIESGESALVFTQFIQTLNRTADVLKKNNIPVFVLHGGVPTKQRQVILSEFHNLKSGAVLLMTLKTGGVGLNLTKASYVFHLEPWWNPSVENQATDRAHRLGQEKPVQVFKYIMHESLEEKIEILKERKDRKFQTLLSDIENPKKFTKNSSGLSKEDFDLLIST
jgi:SNF2 family DNA or RNA helicase